MSHPSASTISHPLNPSGVEVWRVLLDVSSTVLAAAVKSIPSYELAQINSFKRPEIRARQLLAHAALRSLLAGRLNVQPQGIAFRMGPHGKPLLADENTELHFNLSHSDDLALIALSQAFEVGIDVEHIRPIQNVAKLAERFFTPGEASALAALPEAGRTAAFFGVWTRKESVLKAKGLGIANGLQRVEVACEPDDGLLAWDGNADEATQWTLRTWSPAEGYVATVAALQPGVSIEFRDFEFTTS